MTKEEHSEEEFDKFMLNYFTNPLLKELFFDIGKMLSDNKKVIFDQCVNSFNREEYALCSLGLYSILTAEVNILYQSLLQELCHLTTNKFPTTSIYKTLE